MIWNNQNLIDALKAGKIIVMPTDTIYGVVCSAFKEESVQKIYELRKRAPDKPCIILIGDIAEFEKFGIKLSKEQKTKLKECWPASSSLDGPGPVSVILDCLDEKFSCLHRGTRSLAFRIPNDSDLRNMLIHAGPLLAPSANTEGAEPAKNISEAKKYFSDGVDLYVDGGEIVGAPSKVIKLHKDGTTSILRE